MTQKPKPRVPRKAARALSPWLLAGLLAAGGAFGAVWMGALDSLIGGAAPDVAVEAEGDPPADAPETVPAYGAAGAFHEMDPIAVSIGHGGESRQLRIRVVLDVPADQLDGVASIGPRLQDGILGFLRAVEPATLENPAALIDLRAHMLRRARLIAGDEAVSNLLVTDFVLN